MDSSKQLSLSQTPPPLTTELDGTPRAQTDKESTPGNSPSALRVKSPAAAVYDSTDNGTVIMPRPRLLDNETLPYIKELDPLRQDLSLVNDSARLNSLTAKSDSGKSDSGQKFVAGSSARALAPLTPEEEAELVNQQTVISVNPLEEAPQIGSLTSREMGKLLAGQTLGHYALREFVGGGGMGAVFRALDTMLNRIVAVKVLAPNQSRDEETLRRFQNEAQSAARLDHENIGRVYNFGHDRGWHFIVFEFIEGVNLRELVEQQGPLSIPDTLLYMLQLSEALAHASGREVVHRDIKPSNIIVTPEQKAKLVDMGLARLHQVDQQQEDLTASGVTLGTFDYISPEQARDPRVADVRSDLYSLGCTLYFMLSGAAPFSSGTVLQKLLKHQSEDPTDPRTLRPELPADLIKILRKLMAKSPEARYQTATQLTQDLRVLAEELGLLPHRAGLSTVWSPPVKVAPPWWYYHLPWIAPVVLSLIIGWILYTWDQVYAKDYQPQLISAQHPGTRATTATKPLPSATNSGVPKGQSSPAAPADQAFFNPKLPAQSQNFALDDKSPPATNSQPTFPELALAPEGAALPPAARQNDKGNSQNVNLSASPGTDTPITDPASTDDWQSRIAWSTKYLNESVASLQTQYLPQITSNLPKWQFNWPQLARESLPATGNANPDGNTNPPPLPESSGGTSGRLIVTPNPQRGGEFASLAAACRAAREGATVILDYDGLLIEQPFTLSQPNLTIAAAPQRQPIIRFRPGGLESAASIRGMLTMMGGQLNFERVHLEFELPGQISAKPWAFFHLRQITSLRFVESSLTIRNGDQIRPRDARVSFFELSNGPNANTLRAKTLPRPRDPVILEGLQSTIRGAAVIINNQEQVPLRFHWEQGFLATSETLLAVDIGQRPAAGQINEGVTIELRNVTAVLWRGLARIKNALNLPDILPVSLDLRDSVIRGSGSGPFLELENLDDLNGLQDALQWRSSNFLVDGYTSPARITAAVGTTNVAVNQWNEIWQLGERQLAFAPLPWATPADRLPEWHRIEPGHLALKSSTFSNTRTVPGLPPTEGNTSDKGDAAALPAAIIPRPTPLAPESTIPAERAKGLPTGTIPAESPAVPEPKSGFSANDLREMEKEMEMSRP
ncbi:MAG: protein kinase [Pirellulales bacterium]|nr:protein kinase [Pirellulales bacterium]